MSQSLILGLLLIGLLSCKVLNGLSVKRELTCQRASNDYTQGTTYTINKCVDVCLCQDDGKFQCQTCTPKIPANKCNGWAHELIKVPFHVGNRDEGCQCFKYECHKKSVKSILKTWWQKIKNKFSSKDDESDIGDEY